MKNIIKVFILFILLLLPLSIQAEVREIICEGSYNMGDGETPSVAESRALLNAKRAAVEQAGTYIESYSKVKNFQLTEDEIKVTASGLIEVMTLEKKRTVVGDGFHFRIKIKATVNSDKIDEMARKAKDKSTIEEYKRVQAAYDKSQKEIEDLKKQLTIAKGDQKKAVEAKIAEDEKRFQANQWYEKGAKHYYVSAWVSDKQYDKAMEAFTVSIAMDPTNGKAYALRGDCYRREGNIQKAIADFKKAASLCSGDCRNNDKYGLIYLSMHMGNELFKNKNFYTAIEAYSIPGAIYDDHYDSVYRSLNNIYYMRGYSYQQIGQYSRAIEDYNRAFKLIPSMSNQEQALVYGGLGFSYYKLGNKRSALENFQKCCNLGNAAACRNAEIIRKEI